MRPLCYNSAHLTKDLAQAQGGHCWRSPAKSWVSWQPGTVGRSDLCNTICGYGLGQGLVAKGAGAPDEVCSRSHGLMVSWFPGERRDQGVCVTSALGTALLLFGSKDVAPSGVHAVAFTPSQAEQAHLARKSPQKSTQMKCSSDTETQDPGE